MSHQIVTWTENDEFSRLLAKVLPFSVRGDYDDVSVFYTDKKMGIIENDKIVCAFTCEIKEIDGCFSLHVCAAGSEGGTNLTRKIFDFCVYAAKRIDVKMISCDTKRPGLSKILMAMGCTENGYLHTYEVK